MLWYSAKYTGREIYNLGLKALVKNVSLFVLIILGSDIATTSG